MTPRPSLSIRQAADIPGITETASISGIRSLYRAPAKEWHSDLTGNVPGDSHDTIARLNEAYEVIMQYCLHCPVLNRWFGGWSGMATILSGGPSAPRPARNNRYGGENR